MLAKRKHTWPGNKVRSHPQPLHTAIPPKIPPVSYTHLDVYKRQLLTMINSCANGIAVLNIDNGYGAGYMATQINRLAERDGNHSFGEETEHE